MPLWHVQNCEQVQRLASDLERLFARRLSACLLQLVCCVRMSLYVKAGSEPSILRGLLPCL